MGVDLYTVAEVWKDGNWLAVEKHVVDQQSRAFADLLMHFYDPVDVASPISLQEFNETGGWGLKSVTVDELEKLQVDWGELGNHARVQWQRAIEKLRAIEANYSSTGETTRMVYFFT